jgi:hypothetical protein
MKWKASWLIAGAVGAAIGWGARSWRAARSTPVADAPPAGASSPPGSTGALAPSRAAPPSPSPSPHVATAAPATCAEELAKTRAELAKFLPPNERFARGSADPGAERRIGSDLDRVLKEVTHTVECRDRVCKIEIVEPRDRRSNWMGDLQEDKKLGASVRGMMFAATTPTKDPVSGEPLERSDVYVAVADPEETHAADLLLPAVDAFKASGDVAACGRRFPGASGDLDAAVWLKEGSGFDVDSGGTLAMTEAGSCIESALRAALARIRLPDRYSTAVVHTRFKLP